jgi:cell volume regulation protein A
MLIAGVLSTKLSARIGIPALVLFILGGMILGSDISGLVYFDDAWLSQLVGTVALVIILFAGGLQTEWKDLRQVTVPAFSLATVGVLVTVGVTGVITRFALGLDWPSAMLVGAIVGSTDAAAVFAVIGNQNIPHRLKATLEAESGLNDPMAVFLTVLMLEWIHAGPPNGWAAIGLLLWEMLFGAAAGLFVGWTMKKRLVRLRLGSGALYPILLLALALFTFAATTVLHGSGFVAVYVLAVYLGSVEMPYRQIVLSFHDGLAWLAQIVMFVLLGLLVFPRDLPPVMAPGLLIAAGLMLVARPLAVWLSTLRMGFSVNERWLLAWAGLRGAVPIVLATYPMLVGAPGSHMIFNVVFFVVLTSAAVQGATIPAVARQLGLVKGKLPTRAIALELVAMEKLNADLLEIVLAEGSSAVGRRLAELSLPDGVTVSAMARAGRMVAPRGSTRLQAGDILFVLAEKEKTPLVRTLLEGA